MLAVDSTTTTASWLGVSGQLLHKLQIIQNAAARIITATKTYERMKPVPQELHWLPVRQRITYKTSLLMYKCIHGLAPSYLAACSQPTSHCAGRTTSGPPTSSCRFHERGRATAIGVSWSTVPLCGTVCRLRYVHRTLHWTYLKIN